MILSASRRTDIPAFFGEWLLNRLRAGSVPVRNPRNPAQESRIALSPETVDCIVFWTKDPAPLLPKLDELDALGYRYVFLFTLNNYGAMIEPAAVGAHATSRAGDLTGKNVVVSGAGTIGNLVAQFALARGARRVLITDVSDYRLETARRCGVADTLNVAKTPLKEGMKAVFGDEGFQVGFEVAGVESSIRPLMECAEKGGTIVVVAVFAKDPALSMFFLGEHELILAGTMMYRHEDYLTAVGEIASGKVTLAPLVTDRFAFEQYDEAYRFIARNQEKCMKVIIDLEQ